MRRKEKTIIWIMCTTVVVLVLYFGVLVFDKRAKSDVMEESTDSIKIVKTVEESGIKSDEINDKEEIDYDALINQARDCLIGKSKIFKISDDLRISIEFEGYNKDYQDLGYCIADFNNDGVDELIFGVISTPNNPAWEGYVYDIYTREKGKTVQLADGAARYHWYICEDGIYSEECSSNAFSNGFSYYSLNDGKLKLLETVIKERVPVDEDKNEDIWLYSDSLTYEMHYQSDRYDIISEEKAKEIMGKYKIIYPNFVPFE